MEPDVPRGYVLLTYQGHSLGFAKNIGNRANNLYPAEWRIRSGYLLRYLERRKIPVELARVYCKEVIVRNNERGQNFTLVGFENNAGGYALKSPGGLKSTSRAGITTVNIEGKRSVVPTTDNVSIFEGFFDFLSWLVLQSATVPSCDSFQGNVFP